MLIVFTRAIIVYIFLLIAMRLMGKKQLGELQPFEFAISLIVADLACIPMGDTAVPLSYGLIPIFTLFVLHFIVTKIVKHSIKLRGIINGNPVVVINPNGIDYKLLKRLDMTMSDLLESLRSAGYFSPSDVEYAIVETNGNLSVLPKAISHPIDTENDDNRQDQYIPITLIMEGKEIKENIGIYLSKEDIKTLLDDYHLRQKDVLLLSSRGDEIYLQAKNQPCILTNWSKP